MVSMSSAEAELHWWQLWLIALAYLAVWSFYVATPSSTQERCSSGKVKAIQISTDRIFLTLGQTRFVNGTNVVGGEDNNAVGEAEYEEMTKKHEKNQSYGQNSWEDSAVGSLEGPQCEFEENDKCNETEHVQVSEGGVEYVMGSRNQCCDAV